jgi:hypothetical protein
LPGSRVGSWSKEPRQRPHFRCGCSDSCSAGGAIRFRFSTFMTHLGSRSQRYQGPEHRSLSPARGRPQHVRAVVVLVSGYTGSSLGLPKAVAGRSL